MPSVFVEYKLRSERQRRRMQRLLRNPNFTKWVASITADTYLTGTDDRFRRTLADWHTSGWESIELSSGVEVRPITVVEETAS